MVRLRSAGYDVVYGSEDACGAEDCVVLQRAVGEERIILTFDRDYGELIYRLRMPVPKGVIYFRYIPTTPEEPAQDVLHLLSFEGLVLEGYFTVFERTHLRQRPLP